MIRANRCMGYRPRIRASNDQYRFYLYPPDTALGWRVIRKVTLAEGAEKVLRGEWREVHDEHGDHWGYQVLVSSKTDQDIPSGATSSSITVNECELNAGLGGEWRTKGLPEDKRLSRFRRTEAGLLPVPAEDAIERAQAKVAQWPYPASRIDDGKGKPVWGDRAVRVYPKKPKGRGE